jgi:hypothetical protein
MDRRKRFGDFQPIPKQNPFFWQPPASVSRRDERRRVPFCIGSKLGEARTKLTQQGLRVGATDSNDDDARIISQDPLPWTTVANGSEVKLMMKLPQPGGSSGGGGFWPPPLPF